mgnify:CR=1 FL=1
MDDLKALLRQAFVLLSLLLFMPVTAMASESVFDTERISGGTLGGIVSLVSRDCVDDRISLIPYYSRDKRRDKTLMRVWLKEK